MRQLAYLQAVQTSHKALKKQHFLKKAEHNNNQHTHSTVIRQSGPQETILYLGYTPYNTNKQRCLI